jgi:hypothetical protein
MLFLSTCTPDGANRARCAGASRKVMLPGASRLLFLHSPTGFGDRSRTRTALVTGRVRTPLNVVGIFQTTYLVDIVCCEEP